MVGVVSHSKDLSCVSEDNNIRRYVHFQNFSVYSKSHTFATIQMWGALLSAQKQKGITLCSTQEYTLVPCACLFV